MVYRNKKLFLTVGLLTFLALMPMSCGLVCTDSCGCSPNFPEQKLLIKSFEVLTVAGDGQRIQPTLTQPYDQVFKAIRIKDFDLVSLAEPDFFQPWTLGAAFACSPPPVESIEKLRNIEIINLSEQTLADGTVLKLGETITPYFGMNDFFAQGLIPVNDFLKNNKDLVLEDFFKLGFTKNPGKPINLEITIRIVMENGKEFILNNQIHSIR